MLPFNGVPEFILVYDANLLSLFAVGVLVVCVLQVLVSSTSIDELRKKFKSLVK